MPDVDIGYPKPRHGRAALSDSKVLMPTSTSRALRCFAEQPDPAVDPKLHFRIYVSGEVICNILAAVVRESL